MPAPAVRHRDNAPDALSVLNSVFGLPAFRGAQQEIVRHVTGGGNCLVLMPTGGGKSLCYQLPSLLRDGCGIVVSPLIALMRDQVAGLLEAGVKAAVLNSTLSYEEADAVEARLLAGDLDTGKAMLRDYVNASITFDGLAKATRMPTKSLQRMLGPRGNPTAESLFAIFKVLQKSERIRLAVTHKRAA